MAEKDKSHTLAFLYKIIDDNQATIRFLDTKAGFGIAILGAIVGKVLLDQDQIAAFKSHGAAVTGLSILFGLFVVLAAILGFKTVFPTINPSQNVSFPDDLEPRFFISKFSCCRYLRLFSSNKKFAMLKETHADYCGALRAVSIEQLESIIAAEVLKLLFIRQLKTDRLRAFATALVWTVILFIVLMFAARKRITEVPIASSAVPTAQGVRDGHNCSPPHSK